MKHIVFASAVALAGLVGTTASAAVIGITEGTRDLVQGTTAVSSTDTSSNPADAYDFGALGSNTFEVYGRIVDSIDNFAFGFTATSAFEISWIFDGYNLDSDGSFVSESGFVSEAANDEKTATFRLLQETSPDVFVQVGADQDYTTDVLAGDEPLIFSGLAGSYVLQIDGSGDNAPGSGVGLYDVQLSAVPLPAGILLLGTALGGLGIARSRKAKKAAA